MTIDKDGVRHIARLAHLELPASSEGQRPESLMTDDEVERYRREMEAFLAHVDQLQALDLSAVEPTSHGVPLPTRFRVDRVEAELPTDEALRGAPRTGHGGFLVPKVVDER